MKFIPFRQIVFSILLPVLIYVWGVPCCERYFTGYHKAEIDNSLLESEKALLDGEGTVKGVVRDNIADYIANSYTLALFSCFDIKVVTGRGEVIYPVSGLIESPLTSREKLAADNYRLMADGLHTSVTLYTQPDSLISLLSLFLLSSMGLAGLYVVYRRQTARAMAEHRKREGIICSHREREAVAEKELEALSYRQEVLKRKLVTARKALDESTQSQNGLLEEVEVLEALLQENDEQLGRQSNEIETLTRKIEELTPVKEKKPGKRKTREKEAMARRMKTLYKELRVHERALKGFLDLEEGMRLKCEEVIHQLNGDPDRVTVKRKVFGGKGIDTFFETEFAYKGRLYFMRHPGGKVEVVAIGTKNSQSTEMGFLNRISGEMKPA